MTNKEICLLGERYLCGHLEGRLDSNEAAAFAAHCETCQICKTELELWSGLAKLPMATHPPQPSAEFSRNFASMLAREVQQAQGISPAASVIATATPVLPLPFWAQARYALPMAAALAMGVFLAGYGTGAGGPKPEIQQLREEVRNMRSLVAVSLLQQQSTSERLRGVTYSTGLENPDHEVVDALLRTLREDTSVDVRMSAADALRKYSGQARVRQSMAETLRLEKSPLVQLALIDALVASREQRATPVLQFLARDASMDSASGMEVDPTVRKRAAQALREMQLGGPALREEYK